MVYCFKQRKSTGIELKFNETLLKTTKLQLNIWERLLLDDPTFDEGVKT